LPELKQVLGTTVDTTVFRKLKELSYRSSNHVREFLRRKTTHAGTTCGKR
jgi:hypothetical protein